MPQRPKEYYRPATLQDALELLKRPDAAALAGGTRLLQGDIEPACVVDLQALGLNTIDLLDDQLRVGATVTLRTLYDSGEISGDAADILRKGLYQAGPNTFRNAATLGGVIASREVDSELLAVLLVLETRLVLAGAFTGEISLRDYLRADERPDGLITEVIIPWHDGQGSIERVARTPADRPIVAVVAWRSNGFTHLAVSGAAHYVQSLSPMEGDLNEMAIISLVEVAQSLVIHDGDFRGSAEYRSEMVGVLSERALLMLR